MGSPSHGQQRYVGKLKVTVHEGRDLTDPDMGPLSPFATLQLGRERFKTRPHNRGGKTPRWEQSFVFNLDYLARELLSIQVLGEDLVSNDKIGRADIPLNRLMDESTADDARWFPLVEFDNFKRIAGYIRLSSEYTPAA